MARAMGKIASPTRAITILAAIAALLPASKAFGIELDLTTQESGTIGAAIFSRADTHPAGTGVYDPFLTLQSQGNQNVEQGYNTSGGLPLDDKRPHWTHDLQLNQLKDVSIAGVSYFAFELDANETGNGNDRRTLSVDNIRIYTSPKGSQTPNNPDSLGKLRYALNPLLAGATFDVSNWIKIDASKKEAGSTSGSGSSDMVVYVPTSLFTGASPTDFVYFYNLNGVHDGADGGFEEWRALTGVPDGGNTLVLLGAGLTALVFWAGRRGLSSNV